MEKIDTILQSKLPFYSKLDDNQKNLLLQNSQAVKYTKNKLIYAANAECLGVLLVCSGELCAYLLSDEGKELTLYRLKGGDTCIMSASCMLKTLTFDVYISAETDCDAVLINASTFEKLQRENIYVENFALKTAADRFSDVVWTMEQMLFYKFDKRLAMFLIDEYHKDSSKIIQLTHEQIAKYIGSAREVVSRALKAFERQNIVSLKNSQITLIDIPKLSEMIK